MTKAEHASRQNVQVERRSILYFSRLDTAILTLRERGAQHEAASAVVRGATLPDDKVFILLRTLDGLAGVSLALADRSATDVEVKLAVVVEPERVREQVIDDPLTKRQERFLRLDFFGTVRTRTIKHT